LVATDTVSVEAENVSSKTGEYEALILGYEV